MASGHATVGTMQCMAIPTKGSGPEHHKLKEAVLSNTRVRWHFLFVICAIFVKWREDVIINRPTVRMFHKSNTKITQITMRNAKSTS